MSEEIDEKQAIRIENELFVKLDISKVYCPKSHKCKSFRRTVKAISGITYDICFAKLYCCNMDISKFSTDALETIVNFVLNVRKETDESINVVKSFPYEVPKEIMDKAKSGDKVFPSYDYENKPNCLLIEVPEDVDKVNLKGFEVFFNKDNKGILICEECGLNHCIKQISYPKENLTKERDIYQEPIVFKCNRCKAEISFIFVMDNKEKIFFTDGLKGCRFA